MTDIKEQVARRGRIGRKRKVNREQADNIRLRVLKGESRYEVAKDLKMCERTVSNILNYRGIYAEDLPTSEDD